MCQSDLGHYSRVHTTTDIYTDKGITHHGTCHIYSPYKLGLQANLTFLQIAFPPLVFLKSKIK